MSDDFDLLGFTAGATLSEKNVNILPSLEAKIDTKYGLTKFIQIWTNLIS